MPVEYGFLPWNYTSFPSSLKIVAPYRGPATWVWTVLSKGIGVTPGSELTVRLNIKQQNRLPDPASHIQVEAWDGEKWTRPPIFGTRRGEIPAGSFDWTTFELKGTIPSGVYMVRVVYPAGSGEPEAITWLDDLRVYMDDKLIYENKFSNWRPFLEVPAVAVTAVASGVAGLKAARKAPSEWWK